jgi:ubiquinone/menaquinone biosynthesis C-methylase UbiE
MDEPNLDPLEFQVIREMASSLYFKLHMDQWLSAVPGLTERLARGIHVLDVGCGAGASTVTMASTFPRSRFLGIEPDAVSVAQARRRVAEHRLDNVYWVTGRVDELAPQPTHDLICAFDGVHDTDDPRSALRAIHAALADDGVYLWSEPVTGVRELAKEAGFSRVEKLPIANPFNQLFALRK